MGEKAFISRLGKVVSVLEKSEPTIFGESPEFLRIFNSPIFRRLYYETFEGLKQGERVEVVSRPGAVIFKSEHEMDVCRRLILLRPNGSTSEDPRELSAHPDARWARIRVYGAVRPGLNRLRLLKKAVRFCYFDTAKAETKAGTPYVIRDSSDPHYSESVKASRSRFFVVKENGYGFYHDVFNETGDWMLLGIEKQLLDRREPEFKSKLSAFNGKKRKTAERLVEFMSLLGTESFKMIPETVEDVVAFEPKKSLPLLIEALNLRENGRHNPCSAFCVILKIAKRHPELAKSHVREALVNKSAPKYYLNVLLDNIEKLG